MMMGTVARPPGAKVRRRPQAGLAGLARGGAALVVLAGLVAGVAAVVRLPGGSPWAHGMQGFALLAALFAGYGLGVWLVASLTRSWAVVLTLVGAVATQLAA